MWKNIAAKCKLTVANNYKQTLSPILNFCTKDENMNFLQPKLGPTVKFTEDWDKKWTQNVNN